MFLKWNVFLYQKQYTLCVERVYILKMTSIMKLVESAYSSLIRKNNYFFETNYTVPDASIIRIIGRYPS